jgi:phosphoribosylamine--glycine ligase
LEQSPRVTEVWLGPGNGAAQATGRSLLVDPRDAGGVLDLVRERRIDLTVIGPDDAVAAGVADELIAAGRAVFGPTSVAGKIESSKAFAKELMRDAGIPTAGFEVFEDPEAARKYVTKSRRAFVVKADGLALGKGVHVCATVKETLAAIDRVMVERVHGGAGARAVIEDKLSGPEVSLMCFSDGVRALPMAPARDYKRVGAGDKGPNTGGMGAYSPPADVDGTMVETIVTRCAQPALDELRRRGTPYRGCLYTQVMLTDAGPRVIEFNARFGDPEAQVVLPRLKSDLVDIMLACAAGDAGATQLEWDEGATVGVVLASHGYPGEYEKGKEITGLGTLDPGVVAFHAGTRQVEGRFLTSGGRVLTVVARGDTVAAARRLAYANAVRVTFEGAFSRPDIAA